MAISYYVSLLSDNIGELSDGALLCRDVVIGRTGYQTYKIRDLPPNEAEDLRIDLSDPNADIELYRSAEEVFSKATLGSFEGKSVTDGHPPKFLSPAGSPETADDPGTLPIADFQKGHVQNIRKGKEPLDSGEYPILADLIITGPQLIDLVISKQVREVSCGYGYHLARKGNRIDQVDITGNHVALVPRGRAGAEARIYDAAPAQDATPISKQACAKDATKTERKEYTVTNILKHVFGLGMKALAQDADPEKLADAAAAYQSQTSSTQRSVRANDAEEEEKKKEDRSEEKREGKDAAGPAIKHATDCPCRDCADASAKMKDEVFNQMKDTDFYWDSANQKAVPIRGSKGYSKKKAGDAEEESEEEGEHESEDAVETCAEYEKEREHGSDSAEMVEPVGEDEKEAESKAKAADAVDILKELRPFVARSGDPKLKKAFNAAAARANDSGRVIGKGAGRYGKFDTAARQTGKHVKGQAADQGSNGFGSAIDQSELDKLNEIYSKRLKGLPITQEVN